MEQEWSPVKPYKLYDQHDYFYLSCKLSHLPQTQYIRINKQTVKIETLTQNKFEEETLSIKSSQHMFLIGILILNKQVYLLMVSSAKVVFENRDDSIYQVQTVKHYVFHPFLEYDSSNVKEENQKILAFIENDLIKNNFYFRFRSDITLTCQKNLLNKKNTDVKFFWNKHMVVLFKESKTHKCWRLPLMQGFVRSRKLFNNVYYLLINRRSKFQSGPRYLCRGLDENNSKYAANYNQTEQVFKISNNLFSHVELRGTVPVFWSQQTGAISFRHSQKLHFSFKQHIQTIQQEFPTYKIFLISWLLHNKQQKLLRQKFQDCFFHSKQKYNQISKYGYFSIDLAEQQKGLEQLLIKKLNSYSQLTSQQYNFFWMTETGKTQEIIKTQKIIHRINCLDCTHRSNAIMGYFSLKFLKQVQLCLKINNRDFQKLKFEQDIKKKVTELWEQLGNQISLQYCGVQAAPLFKKQQSSFFSFFKNIKDYYVTASDQFKQKCIKQLLNQIEPKQVGWIQNNVQNIVADKLLCQWIPINIYILTWNCNMCNPNEINKQIRQKLFDNQIKKIDLIIVNLQEMVQLNSSNVLMGNNFKIMEQWKAVLQLSLNQLHQNNDPFQFVVQRDLVGVATYVYMRKSLKHNHFQAKKSLQIKTGFGNSLGNKGAVLILLKFQNTWISFVNCHLAAGDGKKNQRIQDLKQILYYGITSDQNKEILSKSDYVFLIGDLNFRVEMEQKLLNDKIYQISKLFENLKSKQQSKLKGPSGQIIQRIGQIMIKDEITDFKSKNRIPLQKFKQSKITFLPTYKFVKKSQISAYDAKRSQAWCDRILYYSQKQGHIQNLTYTDIEVNLSDHKPVKAIFKCKIKKIADKQKYATYLQKLKTNYYSNQNHKIQKAQQKNIVGQKPINKKQKGNVEFTQIGRDSPTKKLQQNLLLFDIDQFKGNQTKNNKLPSKDQNLIDL